MAAGTVKYELSEAAVKDMAEAMVEMGIESGELPHNLPEEWREWCVREIMAGTSRSGEFEI